MNTRGSLSWWLMLFLGMVVTVVVFAVGIGVAVYSHVMEGLPSVDALRHYRPPVVTSFYASDGSLVAEFFHERRYVVPFEDIPPHVVKAFLAAEDSRFYEHPGVDIWGVLRAALANLKAGSIVQGGSTITQQVVKSLLLSPERTWQRKIREAVLAYKIDKFLSKQEVLHLYLNQVYFGAGAYGVEAAAQVFFGKHVRDLTIAEAAMIAGLPKAPSRFNPYENPDEARRRQLYVIQRMEEEHMISRNEAEEARRAPLVVKGRRGMALHEMNHFVEEVRRKLVSRYGEKMFYEEGLQIYTTMDPTAQALAQRTLLEGLRQYEKRHGFQGPGRVLPKAQWDTFLRELKERQEESVDDEILDGLVLGSDDKKKVFRISLGARECSLDQEGWKWTQRSYTAMKALLPSGAVVKVLVRREGETTRLSLEQSLEIEGAFVLAELKTGDVRALVGGRDFRRSQFNRATQAHRQPGSAFKPIVYAAAIDRGFTEVSTVVDAPIVFKAGGGKLWTPGNYDGRFMGPMTLRRALALSRNVVAVKLMNAVGVENVLTMARQLGIESPLTSTLTLSLGASGLPLVELAQAFSVFGNGGELAHFRYVTHVLDRDGHVVEEFPPIRRPVLSPETAYIITDMLMAVVQEGTGRAAASLGRPVAGKTGTSNEFRDAWFIGYTPNEIAGVWVGYDDNTKSLGQGETGGKVACPIWTAFMKEWLRDKPILTFSPPPGVVFVKVGTTVDGEENEAVTYLPFKSDALPGAHRSVEGSEEGTGEETTSVDEKLLPNETTTDQSVYKSGLF